MSIWNRIDRVCDQIENTVEGGYNAARQAAANRGQQPRWERVEASASDGRPVEAWQRHQEPCKQREWGRLLAILICIIGAIILTPILVKYAAIVVIVAALVAAAHPIIVPDAVVGPWIFCRRRR